jgi:hypothetical protein
MPDTTIFSEGQTPDGNIAKPAVTLPDSVKDLIGEGKKYTSVEAALAALPHAQSHIQRIEEENKQLREKAGTAVSTEEVLQSVRELLAAERSATPGKVVDEATIAGVIDRTLTAREEAANQQRNKEAVMTAMRNKYGDKAEEMYKSRAAELGMSVEYLNSLSRTSATAALELLGVKPTASPSVNPSKGSLNTEAFRTQNIPPQRKNIMTGGATTKDMLEAWRAAKPTQE